ncbi:3'-5' DNA helicase [Elasticomyces elasticus]|nr:3'-5' DNA helicase [Elasticomyces elasticus]KAK4926840.1 3'-5' DNA helicase [Elasticomyces elasticus]KAK5763675.1 3'-5' DNA helicase [Elasticomyces elasticus]
MVDSDDFGSDGDDTLFLAAATQAEASQRHGNNGGFDASPRPAKRRRVRRRRGPGQLDGASSEELEWSETDDEGHSPPKASTYFQSTAAAPTQAGTEGNENDDPEYYFPGEGGSLIEEKSAAKPRFKIHVPQNGGIASTAIFSQTQHGLDADPTEFRGAIWKKPKPPPPPLFNPILQKPFGQITGARPLGQQNTLNGHFQRANGPVQQRQAESDAAMAARLQAEEDAMIDLGLAEGPVPDSQLHEELVDLPSDAFESSSTFGNSPRKDVIDISSSHPAEASQPPLRAGGLRAPQTGLKQMTIFGHPATQDLTASQAGKKKHAWPLKAKEEPPTHHKLDSNAMETWVYPTNLGTIRDYQYNIVSRSLYHNTLVALPTGLGKTFIAATVMLNYYRWTTNAQIIFMAPTKPLIAQQMDACYHIVGIPRSDTVLMTGETTPGIRADEWLEKRVFFMTPQTVINDLKTGICDPKKIVLVVVDEAHKATGAYAYTEVIAFLHRFNSSFRVLALTATPGSTVEAVQSVIDHLGIARVELRTESSLDIRPYTHEKQTDVEVFDYSDEQSVIMELLTNAVKPVLNKLCQLNAYWSRDPMQLSAFVLNQSRGRWSQSDAGRKAPPPVKGMVQSIFSALSSLAHSVGLLKFHGIGPFYSGASKFRTAVEAGEIKGKNAKEIVEHPDFVKMMGRMDGWMRNPDFIGHPKLQYLREVVLNHFLDAGEGALGRDAPPSATRVMVFASYRDSVDEICRVLKRNEPMIRPHVFVGQAGSATSEGMNQKRQNEVIQDFKAGKFNTLVATSIGEEGLDIGDVDLIVCYDASSSPIRMLQRIGRTGRKRIGKVVLLLMREKEEKDYEKAKDNYAFIQKSIADESKYDYRDEKSPRILPREVKPVVDRRIIEIPVENSQAIDLNEKNRKTKGGKPKKRPPKKFNMPDNVQTGFVKASRLGEESDGGGEAVVPKKRKTSVKKAPVKKAKEPTPEREPEVAQVPYMGDVLLSAAQQRDLERKYAHTADVDDMVVRAPDAGRYPEAFRTLGGTRYMPHGRAAETVSKAMRNLHAVDDVMIARMKDALDRDHLVDAGTVARKRLVSPPTLLEESDDDLSINPLPKIIKVKTKTKAKKPRGRPPREKQSIQRATSYNSVAMEGDESEPEPTPADMRIGTQGIDLGSRDTDGEDQDEEPDSELEAFIARSDEVVEMASSSLPGTPEVAKGKGRLVRNKGKGKVARDAIVLSDLDEGDEDEEMADDDDDGTAIPKAAPNARKKRVVADSDSE